ncbi:hypothetical protein P0D88_05480 [Paraburkholderia sp. RL18-103-BIB-C]|uniref:hypothetical protein n=1 Tax=Paraburkholderia sp. RL18-103-BIB-C TaxID=3031637 RepID=UPI0038B90E7B
MSRLIGVWQFAFTSRGKNGPQDGGLFCHGAASVVDLTCAVAIGARHPDRTIARADRAAFRVAIVTVFQSAGNHAAAVAFIAFHFSFLFFSGVTVIPLGFLRFQLSDFFPEFFCHRIVSWAEFGLFLKVLGFLLELILNIACLLAAPGNVLTVLYHPFSFLALLGRHLMPLLFKPLCHLLAALLDHPRHDFRYGKGTYVRDDLSQNFQPSKSFSAAACLATREFIPVVAEPKVFAHPALLA